MGRRIERDHNDGTANGIRLSLGGGDERLVAEVDAVEVADRHSALPELLGWVLVPIERNRRHIRILRPVSPIGQNLDPSLCIYYDDGSGLSVGRTVALGVVVSDQLSVISQKQVREAGFGFHLITDD
jgi:hypothetical protein